MNSNLSCCREKIVSYDNLDKKISRLKPCEKCEDISIKKFTPLKDEIDFNLLHNDYKRCECGKRPLDIVMAHILRIMIEENIAPTDATLRKDTPTFLPTVFYSPNNSQFMSYDSIILIHSDFDEKIAKRLFKEIGEVRGVLKGDPEETVGILDKNHDAKVYTLLYGCDIRSDILNTFIKHDNSLEKIIINKKQSKNNIEVGSTTEAKLFKLYKYLKNNKNLKDNAFNLKVIDATCGVGAIGIFLLKYGFSEVIFNDIYCGAIKTCLENLKTNGFKFEKTQDVEKIAIGDNFKVYNSSFEDLSDKFEEDYFDLCVIDCFTNVDSSELEKKANKIAKNVLLI
ncbi:MAG: SAM-dependent methyltransferase [Methanobacteriaceae archaeon]|jgi:tRNA G26 N,N-dimethylase Trm1|nr:SAM-dependent methyltransferase [Methanobacteriaceae archaeon]